MDNDLSKVDEEQSEDSHREMSKARQQECRDVFDRTFQQLLKVKNFSSPTAKLEFISRFTQKLMPDQGLQEADWVVGLMMTGFLAMGPKVVELYMEVRYIKAFA